MASLNRVQLIGNVGKDPEIKSLQYGKVANFSIACSESWKDKTTGEKKEKTEWINVAVFNEGLVGVIEKYVKKGSKIFLEGQFSTREYEKDGSKRYTTEVVIRAFGGQLILLGDGNSGASTRSDTGGGGATQGAANIAHDPDMDIPFVSPWPDARGL